MIELVQFLRPDGRQARRWVERGPEIERMAKTLQASGVSIEAEVLTSGLVSLKCVVRDASLDEPYVLSSRLCKNVPGVLDAFDDMIREAISNAERMVTTA